MISKKLAIAAAFVLLAGAAPALAQDAAPAPAGVADQAIDQAATPATPGTPGAADQMAAQPQEPAAAPAAAAEETKAEPNNPYGLSELWAAGDFVARGTLILLAVMSIGTWYIFFMKFWEQSRVLSQAKIVDKKFWASANLNEGIDTLPKNSMFRAVAESGVSASSGQGTGLVNLNDWIGMSLTRQVEDANARMQGGISFLASVGSTAPFVGLFGTVWGIYHALIAIGIAGQASIDKVAGPVGEALIMTAIGLGVAVPAVLLYNFLVRRNRVILEKVRGFAADLQTYLITRAK
ncbi:MAG TPA: MotA/TolQ/ExbB proton channel family protein [Devosia sp.]|nr:MotA/TolQ/ExbB proton channel family protein [Devosia sp.]HTO40031.1 MotA/TolQ/ExbB proton channel family protein [Rhizomicrobium sp.]